MQSISDKTVPELLELHASVLEELRARNVIRTENFPTEDYAEYLFCKAFGWQHFGRRPQDHEAMDQDRAHYQIKGRRIVAYNSAPQFSEIPEIQKFDYLAAVLFDADYHVSRGALIPVDVVRRHACPNSYTHSLTFYLQDSIWGESGVQDVTCALAAAASGVPLYVS